MAVAVGVGGVCDGVADGGAGDGAVAARLLHHLHLVVALLAIREGGERRRRAGRRRVHHLCWKNKNLCNMERTLELHTLHGLALSRFCEYGVKKCVRFTGKHKSYSGFERGKVREYVVKAIGSS